MNAALDTHQFAPLLELSAGWFRSVSPRLRERGAPVSAVELNNIEAKVGEAGLSINLTVTEPSSAAHTDAERIAEVTGLMRMLNDAATRQCQPVAAAGRPCQQTQLNLRAHIRPVFNNRPQIGATANARYDIEPLGAKPAK